MLLHLYLRREPTQDAATLEQARVTGLPLAKGRRDVVAYRDAACTIRAGRWPWHYRSKPDKRRRFVMLNCWRWRAVWIPDAA